ncbi:MAG: hypothetical protein DI571_13210 [Arsenicicoccus sp.]|nr:MAG: hypothetical protein DI571_13210 [Arsenicicoccus sp.]
MMPASRRQFSSPVAASSETSAMVCAPGGSTCRSRSPSCSTGVDRIVPSRVHAGSGVGGGGGSAAGRSSTSVAVSASASTPDAATASGAAVDDGVDVAPVVS